MMIYTATSAHALSCLPEQKRRHFRLADPSSSGRDLRVVQVDVLASSVLARELIQLIARKSRRAAHNS